MNSSPKPGENIEGGSGMGNKFQRFRRAYVTGEDEPMVAIHTRGLVAMNDAAWEAISRPPAVVFLYNEDEKTIGLEPAEEKSVDAYRVRKGSSRNHVVEARAFLKHFGIPDEARGRRYPAREENGILVFSLDQE